jgi:hypothetical protein
MIAAVGCGAEASDTGQKQGSQGEESDGTSKGAQDDDDDGADQGQGDELSDCSPAAAPAVGPYDGEKVWTQADFDACNTACPEDSAPDCILTDCAPGGDKFAACFQQEVYACLSGGTSPCRAQFGAQYCCGVDKCDLNNEADADKLTACLQSSCGKERDDFNACAGADEVFQPCVTRGLANCLADGNAADDPAATDPSSDATENTQSLDALHFELSTRLSSPLLRNVVRAQLGQ